MKNNNTEYKLYWEDILERIIFAELDDYAWNLAEEIFGYKKINSLYIFYKNKLAAYYSTKDSTKEANVGYKFFSDKKNIKKVIKLKKEILDKVKRYKSKNKSIKLKDLTDRELRNKILESLDLYKQALSVHYLTQPQFFEKFEKFNNPLSKEMIKVISESRFKYTRRAWTEAMKLSKIFLKEYAHRQKITFDQTQSLFYKEISNNKFNKKAIKNRVDGYVLKSENHKLKLYTGSNIDKFIKKYENYQDINSVKGIIGNKGFKKGNVFVIKNEKLNFKKLPQGMRQGMILIIQNAWPELVRYYKLSSAIVTNEGGITSHGVVVAREFDIPCIVGTKIATKIFETGDKVEVDANKGIVKKIG